MTAAVGSARAILALRRFVSVSLPGAGEGAPAAVVVLLSLVALTLAPGCRGKSSDRAPEQRAPVASDAAPRVAADAGLDAAPASDARAPTGAPAEAPDKPIAPEVPVIVDSPAEK